MGSTTAPYDCQQPPGTCRFLDLIAISVVRTWQRSRARPMKHFMYATTENLQEVRDFSSIDQTSVKLSGRARFEEM